MKKENKKISPYKLISRKLQKRKDGKRVYYYINKTDGGITGKENYLANEDLKKKHKEIYKKNWKAVFKEGVKEIKKEEKQYKEFKGKKARETIQNELNNLGFPKYMSEFVNGSFYSTFTSKVINGETVLLQFGNGLYLLDGYSLLDFKYFCDEVLEFYFDKVRELYKLSKKNKKDKFKNTPMLLFNWIQYSNRTLPLIEGSNLSEIAQSEDFTISYGKTKAQQGRSLNRKVGELFNLYLSGLKKVDLVELIIKLMKK